MGPGICSFSWKRVLARQQPWCCGICSGHRHGGVRVRGAARHVGAGQVCTHLTLGGCEGAHAECVICHLRHWTAWLW